MVISPTNSLASIYETSIPNALRSYLEASDSPFSDFLKLSRMSLYDALVFLSETPYADLIVKSYATLPSTKAAVERFVVSEFYTGILSDPSFSCMDQGVYNMFGRMYIFATILNYVRSLISSTSGKIPPMVITSGYRSVSHNNRVGGSATSNHLRGLAVDVACPPSIPMKSFSLLLENVMVAYSMTGPAVESIPYMKRRFIHIAI